MKYLSLLFTATVILFSACQKETMWFDSETENPVSFKNPEVEKPFKAVIDFEIALPDDQECNDEAETRLGFVLSGNASHIGSLSGSFFHCVNLVMPFSAGQGLGTLVAANGDIVYIEYNLDIVIDFETWQSTITGPYSVSGGTGRFVNASGTGEISGSQDLTLPNVPGNAQIQGSIIY